MEATAILEAKHIIKVFPGVRALDDVGVEIREGEVHSIVGENGAGKSTLMKIFSGVFPQDAGDLFVEGEKVRFHSVNDALASGISIIFQEFNLMPDLTVAENVLISDLPRRKGTLFVDKARMNGICGDLMRGLGIDIAPNKLVSELSVSECQLVEIVRAISNDSKIIIMDEPTAALNKKESEVLFSIIRKLNENGKTIIYISHRLKEVFDISDTVTVLRDGKKVGTYAIDRTTQEEIVHLMVGRDIDLSKKAAQAGSGELLYEAKDIRVGTCVNGVSFAVRKGEVLGITGLMGCGNVELVKALYGLIPRSGGTVLMGGAELQVRSPTQALAHRMAFVTDDRKGAGIFEKMTAKENATLSILNKLIAPPLFLLDSMKERTAFHSYAEQLQIKCSDDNQQMVNLSGGNQQKIIVARALMTGCSLLFLLEPSRGIDVGAKAQLHQIIRELAAKGLGVVLVSSDLPEVITLSHRVLVMCQGNANGFLAGDEITEDNIMLRAAGIQNGVM